MFGKNLENHLLPEIAFRESSLGKQLHRCFQFQLFQKSVWEFNEFFIIPKIAFQHNVLFSHYNHFHKKITKRQTVFSDNLISLTANLTVISLTAQQCQTGPKFNLYFMARA